MRIYAKLVYEFVRYMGVTFFYRHRMDVMIPLAERVSLSVDVGVRQLSFPLQFCAELKKGKEVERIGMVGCVLCRLCSLPQC